MNTIKEIFQNSLYRIPDYQRGYSWEKTHLDDFWQDLQNLQTGHIHYTGMISVESVELNEYNGWEDEFWLIQGKNHKPYFIVDGQQRLTTIVILISTITHHMEDDELLSYESKEAITKNYLYDVNPKTGQKTYLFGYHHDNPSYDFLKTEILEVNQENSDSKKESTSYTNNLLQAKRYFYDRIYGMSHEDLEQLYIKVTQSLKFDFKKLEKELDIFIVFETMNNRGKPLSNLEKLKNRLIYLCTLLRSDTVTKTNVRQKINDSWKTVYKYLGLTNDRRMDDDTFLQSHWVMYYRYDRREPEFYAKDIFEKFFTPKNIVDGLTTEEDIISYVDSIANAVKCYFVMINPYHKESSNLGWSQLVLDWLAKLNRLGFKTFPPLVLAAMMREKDTQKLVQLLSAVEAYIFLLYNVSFRRSNTGSYHFSARASDLYNGKLSTSEIVSDLSFWTYGEKDKDVKGYFAIENFLAFLSDSFNVIDKNGFMEWKQLRYFLYEYELHCGGDLIYGNRWAQLNAIDFILPKNPVMSCWITATGNLPKQKLFRLACSLGNLVLVPKSRVLKDEFCFPDKKEFLSQIASNVDGVLDATNWGVQQIEDRGMKLLEFMETRWKINLGSEDFKRKLLFINDPLLF